MKCPQQINPETECYPGGELGENRKCKVSANRVQRFFLWGCLRVCVLSCVRLLCTLPGPQRSGHKLRFGGVETGTEVSRPGCLGRTALPLGPLSTRNHVSLLKDLGAAVKRTRVQGKRNPSKMVGVARGHQRADILKPYSQKLVNLITLGPEPCLTQ